MTRARDAGADAGEGYKFVEQLLSMALGAVTAPRQQNRAGDSAFAGPRSPAPLARGGASGSGRAARKSCYDILVSTRHRTRDRCGCQPSCVTFPAWLTQGVWMLEWSEEVTIILNFSYPMSRQTSTMTISLPEDLKQFVKKRSLTAHYGTPSDYIRGLIREDLKRLEEERLEQELLKGLRSGKGIAMTQEAFKRLRAEAAKRIPLNIASTASITASATFGHSAAPDNVTCWHIMVWQ
jgi:antitoxin ParD1/3/4